LPLIGTYAFTTTIVFAPIIAATGIFWVNNENTLYRLDYTWINGVLTLSTIPATFVLPGTFNSLVYDHVGECLIFAYNPDTQLEIAIIDVVVGITVIQTLTFPVGTQWYDSGAAVRFITDAHFGVVFVTTPVNATNLRIFSRDAAAPQTWTSSVDTVGMSPDVKLFQLVGDGLMLLVFDIPTQDVEDPKYTITKMGYVVRADNETAFNIADSQSMMDIPTGVVNFGSNMQVLDATRLVCTSYQGSKMNVIVLEFAAGVWTSTILNAVTITPAITVNSRFILTPFNINGAISTTATKSPKDRLVYVPATTPVQVGDTVIIPNTNVIYLSCLPK
jgi:hypothetical protein